MGERARYRRAVHFEYAFDRLLAAKLAQAYEILNSDRVRILSAGAQMKESAMRAAAIYARVSSDRQKEEHTIASQTAALMAFAREQDCDVPVEWVFEDEGYSGAVWFVLVSNGYETSRRKAASRPFSSMRRID